MAMYNAQRRQANNILDSQLPPLDKVRRLIALGYDEDDADALVANHEFQGPALYYERLPNPEYDPDI